MNDRLASAATQAVRAVAQTSQHDMLRWLVTSMIYCFLSASVPVHAACWIDSSLVHTMNEVARERFGSTDVPTIFACDAREFPPNVGGDHNAGYRRIRINVTTYPYADYPRYIAVAHELGHHYAAARGADSSFGGHGEAWMSTMRAAGFDAEVRRMLPMYAGLAAAYNAQFAAMAQGDEVAQGWGSSPRPPLQPNMEPPINSYVPPTYAREKRSRQCVRVERIAPRQTPWGMQLMVVGYEVRCQ